MKIGELFWRDEFRAEALAQIAWARHSADDTQAAQAAILEAITYALLSLQAPDETETE